MPSSDGMIEAALTVWAPQNANRKLRLVALIVLGWWMVSSAGCGSTDPANSKIEATGAALATSTAAEKQSYGVVVTADQVTATNLAAWQAEHHPVVLRIDSIANQVADRNAAKAIQAAGLQLDYFIEVARSPELAAAHPEWMASLQGHPEWRRLFPDVPEPNKDQVIKNRPWVPILYRETFAAHVARIKALLEHQPTPTRIWLNDLQAAPSACGCGHPLCRWTADYGPIKTATPLGDNAAADFVDEVKQLATNSEIIPIFAGECEREDEHSVCCGVACFEGKCWKVFTKQLDSLSATNPVIGVACFYREFDRDLPRYKQTAGWIHYTLDSFSTMPTQRNGTGVPANRLIAVLQGWDVTPEQLAAQIERVKETAALGYLVALCPIEQDWQPVVFDLPESATMDDP